MTASTPLLLVEDTPSLHLIYAGALRRAGHAVEVAESAEAARTAFSFFRPKVVILDLKLPDGCGIEIMGEMLATCPETRVIVITADGTISKAVEAMRGGAQEFLVKPFGDQRLLDAVENALNARCNRAATAAPDNGVEAPPGEFIGTSEPMRAVYARIRSVARSMATVFITGESGTGKELCAQAVHAASPRARGPFIALNCGAIPADLLESEVFGHLKGSFTGAISDKPGAAAAADGGTLFLDEVCEMDLSLQTKLLRFLQTATVQPVGATRPRKVDVRILCASNRDPLEAVRQGCFREDLYYRLHVVPIHLPPLRDRGPDVTEIAEVALRGFAAEEGKAFRSLAPEVHEVFLRHDWPGNVRQLLNTIRNIVVLNDGPVVTTEMLPTDLFRDGLGHCAATGDKGAANNAAAPRRAGAAAENGAAKNGASAHGGLDGLIGRPLAFVEQLVIEETIARCGGSVPRAARILDVAPSTIYRKRESWTRRNDGPTDGQAAGAAAE